MDNLIHHSVVSPSTRTLLIVCTLLLLSLTGCPVVHFPAAYGTLDIMHQDFDDIRTGNLLWVRDRYEKRKNSLSIKELALLCDIYVQHTSIKDAFECLDQLEKRPDSEAYAESIRGKRGLIYYMLGDYDRATALTKELDSDGGRYIYALSQIDLGDPQLAIFTANQWRLSYDPLQVFLAANLFLTAGHYDKVLETLQEPERRLDRDYSLSGSKDIFHLTIDPAPLRVDMFGEFGFGLLDTFSFAPQGNVYVEYALAKAELETGEIDKARKRYDLILAFSGIEAYRDVLWRALYERGRIAKIDGEHQIAVDCYKKSIDVIESARASITTDAGRIGFVGDKQEVYRSLVRLLLEQNEPVAAFEYSERARSRALVDLLASVKEFGTRGIPKKKQQEAIRDMARAENRLRDAQVSTTSSREVQNRKRSLDNEYRENMLRDPLGLEVEVLVRVKSSKFDEIRRSLNSDEALLSYYIDGSTLWLYLLKPFEDLRVEELSAPDLNEDIEDFRSSLEAGEDDSETAMRLYNVLIRPVDAQLPRKLTIVPFDKLHYIPFAALRSTANEFLVDKHTVAILPSASVRRFLYPEQPVPPNGILAVGNPTREGEKELPGSEREAVLVSKKQTPGTLLVRKDAKKERFLDSAPGNKVVHIASHGIFDPKHPLQSRLLLAPNAQQGDLTVANLFEVESPWGVELTVLSACKSTVSRIKPGGDIIGLQRGFLYAGTDSIIGTLWDISDTATVYLMERFYSHLNLDFSPAEALRQAQIDTRKQHTLPRDWAAFVYTGLHR